MYTAMISVIFKFQDPAVRSHVSSGVGIVVARTGSRRSSYHHYRESSAGFAKLNCLGRRGESPAVLQQPVVARASCA